MPWFAAGICRRPTIYWRRFTELVDFNASNGKPASAGGPGVICSLRPARRFFRALQSTRPDPPTIMAQVAGLRRGFDDISDRVEGVAKGDPEGVARQSWCAPGAQHSFA
jgi:hypothetical protein